eukprot:6184370-Pleurochrysis_carterae.AAC.1
MPRATAHARWRVFWGDWRAELVHETTVRVRQEHVGGAAPPEVEHGGPRAPRGPRQETPAAKRDTKLLCEQRVGDPMRTTGSGWRDHVLSGRRDAQRERLRREGE